MFSHNIWQLGVIRRTIGNHFTYETGLGLSFVPYFSDNPEIYEKVKEVALNLHIRIGYSF